MCDSNVFFKSELPVEQFATGLTFVALFVSVDHVLPKAVGLFEESSANGALETGVWLVVVSGHVLFDLLFGLEQLATCFTGVRLLLNTHLLGVHVPLVRVQRVLGEMLAAKLAGGLDDLLG